MIELARRCALCDTVINFKYKVCHVHMPELRQYSKETWFQELIKSETRQQYIDLKESELLDESTLSSKASPQTNYLNKPAILRLHSEGKTVKEIASELGVKENSVRQCILRERKTK